MSRTYEFYRTPSQEEIEEAERLSYLEWYEKTKKETKTKEDGKDTIPNKQ